MSLYPRLAWVMPGLIVLALLGLARAADPVKPEPRVAAARCVSESGSFIRREAGKTEWKPVLEKEELFTGDLLIGSLDSALESLNGAVRISVKGDKADKEPYPVLETGLTLNAAKDVDLALTLERGRIRVTNTKPAGPAKVRMVIRGKPTDYILKSPGDAFVVEIYGRWLPGVPFRKNATEKEGPPLAVVFLQIKGETHVDGPKVDVNMKAPPGTALFITDDLSHENPDPPQYLEKLPEWAQEGEPSERVKKIKETLAKLRKGLTSKPIDTVIDDLLKSEDPVDRRAAVVFMGATDDLGRLGDALMTAKHPDVWDNAVVVLRGWIGRGPGQDLLLYNRLIEKRGYTPVQAAATLNLLHSFGEEDLARPETYELLLDYMESDKQAMRGLAYWHLIRLVPEGKKFAYDPLEDQAKRAAAIKKWREYIPPGKLPPRPKFEEK